MVIKYKLQKLLVIMINIKLLYIMMVIKLYQIQHIIMLHILIILLEYNKYYQIHYKKVHI